MSNDNYRNNDRNNQGRGNRRGSTGGNTNNPNAAFTLFDQANPGYSSSGMPFSTLDDQADVEQRADIQRAGKYDDDIAALRKMQENILGYITDYSESLPSLAYNSLNVSEVSRFNASFVYNYFTTNERSDQNVSDNQANNFVSLKENILSEAAAISDTKPRFVRIKFDFDSNSNIKSLDALKSAGELPNDADIDYVANNFVPENALSNYAYTGIEFIDTIADRKIYSMLSSSIIFEDEDYSNLSLSKKAENFLEKIGENQTFDIESKLNLFEILTNYQAEGFAAASSDLQGGIDSISKDPLSQQSFSVKFNNLFIRDIATFSTNTKNNVYSDEMLALVSSIDNSNSNTGGNSVAKNIQEKAIDSFSSGVTTDDFEISVPPLEATLRTVEINLDTEFSPGITSDRAVFDAVTREIKRFKRETKDYPEVTVFGILIQKYELTNAGIEQKNSFLISDLTATGEDLGIIDFKVRYGASYIYKIRTLSLVKTIYSIDSNESDISFKIGSYIVASEGKTLTINCSENVTPKPPEHIRAKINYREQKPTISWEFPVNPQRDIKRFQIFKRPNLLAPFTLVKEYDFDDSEIRSSVNEIALTRNIERLQFPDTIYTDMDFDLHKDVAIYAIASVDAHGLSSGYSPQILIQYDKFANKLKTNVISPPGAPKPYPNLFIQEDFFEDAMKTSGKTRCNVFFNPEYFEVYRKNEAGENEPVGFIKKTDSDNEEESSFPYVFHFINVDNQKDQMLKFKIEDKSGPPGNVDVPTLNQNNLTFELGT